MGGSRKRENWAELHWEKKWMIGMICLFFLVILVEDSYFWYRGLQTWLFENFSYISPMKCDFIQFLGDVMNDVAYSLVFERNLHMNLEAISKKGMCAKPEVEVYLMKIKLWKIDFEFPKSTNMVNEDNITLCTCTSKNFKFDIESATGFLWKIHFLEISPQFSSAPGYGL